MLLCFYNKFSDNYKNVNILGLFIAAKAKYKEIFHLLYTRANKGRSQLVAASISNHAKTYILCFFM